MSDSARYDSWTSADKHGDSLKSGSSNDATVQALDKRIKTMQKELNYSLRRIGEKESEKFDLIFAILSELQNRQAKLEDAVRTFKAQQCGGGVNPAAFGNDENGQKNGGMCMANGQQNGNCPANGCAPMNGQMVQFMPQVVIMSPTGGMNGGGMQPMQYAMVSPTGAAQAMPGQMMQFMGPAQMPNGGMCNENGELMQQQPPADQQQQQQQQPQVEQPQQLQAPSQPDVPAAES